METDLCRLGPDKFIVPMMEQHGQRDPMTISEAIKDVRNGVFVGWVGWDITDISRWDYLDKQ
jgi:hypothetical protein